MMSTPKKDTRHFLTVPSTVWVTLVRLGLIVASSLSSMKWFYNPSFVSILIRPHQSLSQLEEAHAIRVLASDGLITDFSRFYNANDSIRIPPIVLAVFSQFTETTKGSNFGLWLSFLLLFVDILISYLLEQIGIRLLDLDFSSRSSNGGESSSQAKIEPPNEEEKEVQLKLLERVRPQFAHIFPIHALDDDTSEGQSLYAEESSGSKERNTEHKTYEPSIPLKSLPLLSAKMYYWSPFTALPSSLLYCWQNIPLLFLVASVYESSSSSASGGSLSMASFYLAVATYMEPHHVAYARVGRDGTRCTNRR